jgi:cytoskeletal protein CcmA (bactofilin family)
VIGADIVITGNIEASFGLLIEGRVNGDVRCATLILGENSSVTGSIYSDRIRVLGSVDGAIETKDLAIEASGKVVGDVMYERVKIASGGSIDGNMRRRTSDQTSSDTAKLKLVDAPVQQQAAPPARDASHVYIE